MENVNVKENEECDDMLKELVVGEYIFHGSTNFI